MELGFTSFFFFFLMKRRDYYEGKLRLVGLLQCEKMLEKSIGRKKQEGPRETGLRFNVLSVFRYQNHTNLLLHQSKC